MDHHPITVVNTKRGEDGHYIGRGSPLGNPFVMVGESQRDTVCNAYEEWLNQKIKEHDPVVVSELDRLANHAIDRPLNLRCFCAPARCHGDFIKQVLEAAIKEHNP